MSDANSHENSKTYKRGFLRRLPDVVGDGLSVPVLMLLAGAFGLDAVCKQWRA